MSHIALLSPLTNVTVDSKAIHSAQTGTRRATDYRDTTGASLTLLPERSGFFSKYSMSFLDDSVRDAIAVLSCPGPLDDLIDHSRQAIHWERVFPPGVDHLVAVKMLALSASDSVSHCLNSPELSKLRIAHSHAIIPSLKLPNNLVSFCVLVTIFEKALCDMYYSLIPQNSRRKNMILRDLILSSQMSSLLGAPAMKCLQIFFLPSGLNLRNLAWHGFLSPTEFPGCYRDLVLVLILDLFKDTQMELSTSFVDFTFFDMHRNWKGAASQVVDKSLEILASVNLSSLVTQSSFVPELQKDQVLQAFDYLKDGKDHLFLFSILPPLEHSLRVLFAKVNNIPEIATAHLDSYFSTLDGFGQKHKHQVLLHETVLSSGQPNKIFQELNESPSGKGCLAALQDLFMMEKGPNLRGKLCHGELSLKSLVANEANIRISASSALLFLAFIAVLFRKLFDDSPFLKLLVNGVNEKSEATPTVVQNGLKYLETYSLNFHPSSFLKISHGKAVCNVIALEKILDTVSVEFSKDPVNELITAAISLSDGTKVTYTDKPSRIMTTMDSTFPCINALFEKKLITELALCEKVKRKFFEFDDCTPWCSSTAIFPFQACLQSILDLIESRSSNFIDR
ncbi:hypothetical protein HDU83_003873 [Entophlyctis luteolus]|nr:hypothetical protein HDU82_007788 [Entophlyctis luteolus]KAJ3345657.1 hypothetical protein HDU83_003873 [Entophlyctis luteolus]